MTCQCATSIGSSCSISISRGVTCIHNSTMKLSNQWIPYENASIFESSPDVFLSRSHGNDARLRRTRTRDRRRCHQGAGMRHGVVAQVQTSVARSNPQFIRRRHFRKVFRFGNNSSSSRRRRSSISTPNVKNGRQRRRIALRHESSSH